jgi:hypothetical protein
MSLLGTIFVMDGDQKWFCFDTGSYMNESRLPTFDRVAAVSTVQ